MVQHIQYDVEKNGWTTTTECLNRFMNEAKDCEVIIAEKELIQLTFNLFYDQNLINNVDKLATLIYSIAEETKYKSAF